MDFELVGQLTVVETIATGNGIRELSRLRKLYGEGRWRKRKGLGVIRLPGGRFSKRSYTGTRRPESEDASSRSNASF